jgi:hypothetical protein
MDQNTTQENVLFSIESHDLIIVFSILLFIFIVYFVVKNTKQSNSHVSNDSDENKIECNNDKEEDKTEPFYDELVFMFPSLDKLDNPLEVMKFLFENKENKITKEQLQSYSNNISNFSEEGGDIIFDMDGTHFNFNVAQKEISIDENLHVFSNSSGLFFNEDNKSLKVAFHRENDEYVIDYYSVKNPEGISYEVEDKNMEEKALDVRQVLEVESVIDSEILTSDTSY